MKKFIVKVFLVFSVFISFQLKCTKTEEEVIENIKTNSLKHNYIVVNSVDNSPAEVEVSYSVFISGNTKNIVKTERMTTPFIIGGESVQVNYDSIVYIRDKKFRDYQRKLKRNYTPEGADYLSIKNLSSVAIEYAVIGNQKLEFLSADEIANSSDIVNKNEIDKSKVVKYPSGAAPIYKATPVLYLIKPELAPQTIVYVLKGIYSSEGGVSGNKAVAVPLKVPHFGEVIAHTAFSVADILSLYKQEYVSRNILYPEYDTYMNRGRPYNQSISQRKYYLKLYGTIDAGKTLENTGQIWFINTFEGTFGINTF